MSPKPVGPPPAQVPGLSLLGSTSTPPLAENTSTGPELRASAPARPVRREYLEVQRASEIEPSRPDWLWRGWLARGTLHILVGRQGAGKSSFAAWLAAQLSTGRLWPGEATTREPVRVGMLSLEEPKGQIKARLEAYGAGEGVYVIREVVTGEGDRRPWRLPGDVDKLEQAATEHGVELVIIDGLGYALSGDSHRYNEVGQALTSLAAAAERGGFAVLGLTHPPKGGSDPVTAAIGSTAWSSVPRLVWVLGRDPGDETRRVVQVAKTNYREPETGFSFAILSGGDGEVGYVADLQPSAVRAEELTAAPPEAGESGYELDAVLRSILDAAGGSIGRAELDDELRAAGFSPNRNTVGRSLHRIGYRVEKVPGFERKGWRVVPSAPPPVHTVHTVQSGATSTFARETTAAETEPEARNPRSCASAPSAPSARPPVHTGDPDPEPLDKSWSEDAPPPSDEDAPPPDNAADARSLNYAVIPAPLGEPENGRSEEQPDDLEVF